MNKPTFPRAVTYVSSEYFPVCNAVALRSGFHVGALRAAGYAVNVITSGPLRRDMEDEPITGVGVQAPSNSMRLARRMLQEILLGIAFAREVMRHRPNLLVITSPPFFAVCIVLLVARLLSVPHVIDVRDRYPQVFFSQGLISPDSWLGRLLLRIERAMYAHARAIVTVTRTLCEDIRRDHDVAPELVRNGFDAQLFAPAQTMRAACMPVRIVMHGLFGRFFDETTFKRIAQWCWRHAGPHEIWVIGYGQKMKGLASARLPNVRTLPAMHQNDIARELANADIGISVHTNDVSMLGAFPVKVYEYLGAGLPVLVVPRGEAGLTIVEKGFGASFDNGDWNNAAKWLIEMIDDRMARNKMKSAVAEARAEFSRQAQAEVFAAVVRQAAHGGSR